MQSVGITYCRHCLLDQSLDFDYLCNVRGLADKIYYALEAKSHDIRIIKIIISEQLWDTTGEMAETLSVIVNKKINVIMRVDDCMRAGADITAEQLLNFLKARQKDGVIS